MVPTSDPPPWFQEEAVPLSVTCVPRILLSENPRLVLVLTGKHLARSGFARFASLPLVKAENQGSWLGTAEILKTGRCGFQALQISR